ncbi:uncharacterized protein M421DRAFT_9177 [Didymella exigua CBS 183.55]|uniref:Uncharacterized protein n=1 Tax=Didymella exigua CBS 183.55 TaxID=1150837 RepID=A0A6A5R9Z9_9PLEO|nr:uncharacterized protein M421DRAFT_9177 [Didymella exigua CBS 183.55]KAF1924028.1 hypothetical protein M421DRAFT_9177 [Didymella exigua CBS 183.55]
MTVIWGLNLREMQWAKFKSSYMFGNRDYHLRRTKFGIYQGAMILTVVSESLGTAALSDYAAKQAFVAQHSPGTTVHNNTFVGIAAYNILVGIFVATVFGAAFFFDLFWPARAESRAVKTAWRACSVCACLLTLSCVLVYTYIVATRSAYVTGTGAASAERQMAADGGSPLRYADNGRAVASVVFLWPGMVFTFVSTWVLWRSLAHGDRFGPMSSHARKEEGAEKLPVGLDGAVEMLAQPPPTHAVPDADARV